MAKTAQIDPALLRELLDYDPNTGKLYWRPRDRSHFGDERSFAHFNTLFADTEALGCDTGHGYLAGIIKRTKYRAHRVIWAMVHGEWPEGPIDHINHNRSDNRLENLRVVTRLANNRNVSMSKANTSGRTGVAWHKPTQKWRASGRVNGRQTHLGLFKEFEDACRRREQHEREHGYHRNHGT